MKRVPALVCAVLLLAGCGGQPTQVTHGSQQTQGSHESHDSHGSHGVDAVRAGDAGFNADDVMFLQMMVPHNVQGVEIVRLAREREVRPEVRDLTEAIATTQKAENATMAGLLESWKQPPTAAPDEHAAHGGMPGVEPEEIAVIARSAPADFEAGLLNMLIAHQDDAVQLARAASAGGRNAQVRELARRVDVSRSAQIAQMLALLGQ
ncbi:hypothetical protein Misp01_10740 [Microtetraspora sp. NBRC 13810]|uniref:DUF305 domain-containing protein n=1 Tax=Microtetraspora sp. NBRC 13810 TaxID=3030990 RepID=UPI0024A03424|nr:DUF305 domain-containing protein [Microtetraspora sp. NBRC 13810]GLW05944.1 hypothetical protein Misp01_10740 [Microtetraspora sp. NBRC 13810]